MSAVTPTPKRKRTHLPLGDGGAEAEEVFELRQVAVFAADGDNCAVASRDLPRGSKIRYAGRVLVLSGHCLEAHRFAVEPIPKGATLLSWGLPFGVALRDIAEGEYVMNDLMYEALSGRSGLGFELPPVNFRDTDTSIDGKYDVDPKTFKPGKQVALDGDLKPTFEGYARGGARGVGTRNAVVLIGLTVHSASFVRALESKAREWLAKHAGSYPTVDMVCAVAHNEGGASGEQNNAPLIYTTMSGFIVHPNSGATLVVNHPDARLSLQELRDRMAADPVAYPKDGVTVEMMDLSAKWEQDMERAMGLITGPLMEAAGAAKRTPQPLSALRIAQQCGGSDAFSGLSGNPLVGEVSELLIRHGGLALIAESPELVGAEPYILDNCKDLEAAQEFLSIVHRYQRYAARHGQNASGNPSGGNLFRGLYNIALKSLGASRKKTPSVRLDRSIQYGERLQKKEYGYYFMDSPGNDLESISGQVAAGCNVIFFITGNGSITNFPFVPTMKFVTTTRRFNILSKDMDVNAGRYVDGEPMSALTNEVFEQMRRIASGEKSKGERAGHAQVSIWRNWFIPEGRTLKDVEDVQNLGEKVLLSQPLNVKAAATGAPVTELDPALDKFVERTDAVATNLVLPTSLCSGQIARLAADKLNGANKKGALRYANLPSTEGCGGTPFEQVMARVLVGHLRHPLVDNAYVLEHGCEKTHNDWLRAHLAARGLESEFDKYGWGSCQKDGGVEAVVSNIVKYFGEGRASPKHSDPQGRSEPLKLGIVSVGPALAHDDARGLAALTCYIASRGGTVVVPNTSSLLESEVFCLEALEEGRPQGIPSTLAFAETPGKPGLHVMENAPTVSWTETITGLAAGGCNCILVWLGRDAEGLRPGHPFVPTVHACVRDMKMCSDSDVVLSTQAASGVTSFTKELLTGVQEVMRGDRESRVITQGAVDYSIPREKTAISL